MKNLLLFLFLLTLTSCSYKSVNSVKQLQDFEESNRGILVYTFSVRKNDLKNGFSYFHMKNITNGKIRTVELNGNLNTRNQLVYENDQEKRFVVNMTLDPGDYIFYGYISYAEKGRGLIYNDINIPVGTIKEKEITYIGNFYPEYYATKQVKRKKLYKAVIFSRNDDFSKDSLKIS